MHGRNWFHHNDHHYGHSAQQQRHPNQMMADMQQQGCPNQVMPDMQEQPRVSPTREYVRTNIFNTYVPHIHPSHTTTVNKRYIHHQHYFPHTESTVEECFETNTMCGMPTDGCSSRRSWR